MNKNQKIRLIKLIAVIVSLLTLGVAYYLFVINTGIGFSCPIYENTGIICAACGISRMFIALFRFDFITAAKSNIFFLLLLIPFVFFLAIKGKDYVKNGAATFSKTEKIIIVLVIIFAIVFMILRNLPQFSFLKPI